MTSPNDPSFPAEEQYQSDGSTQPMPYSGLTKREYFAITLLAGDAKSPCESCVGYMEQRALVACVYADILIAELNKEAK